MLFSRCGFIHTGKFLLLQYVFPAINQKAIKKNASVKVYPVGLFFVPRVGMAASGSSGQWCLG